MVRSSSWSEIPTSVFVGSRECIPGKGCLCIGSVPNTCWASPLISGPCSRSRGTRRLALVTDLHQCSRCLDLRKEAEKSEQLSCFWCIFGVTSAVFSQMLFQCAFPRIPPCAQEHATSSWSAGLGSGAASTNPGAIWSLQAHPTSVRVCSS